MELNNLWQWHFLQESDRNAFDPDPEAMMYETDVLKNTRFRVVFRKNDCIVKYYITPPNAGLFPKLKSRFRPKARSEFETLCDLQKQCVPAVAPVAWGQNGASGSCLITREMPESISVNDFFHTFIGEENRDCPEFWRGWTSFVRDFLRSGFDHPDFHNGNILYRQDTHKFALVDVYGIKRSSSPDIRKMSMIVREFAGFLPKRQLIKLLENCGIQKPEEFYRDMLRYGARQIRKEFPRRLAQFRNNYEKFVKVKGKMIRNLNGARAPIPLENTVRLEFSPQDAQKAREVDFFLNLCNIPRLRIAAFEAPGTLYVENISDAPPPDGAEADLQERLILCGLDPEKHFFTTDRFGRAVIVPNIYKI